MDRPFWRYRCVCCLQTSAALYSRHHRDIHPDSALTRFYFENIFCLNPITSADGRSDLGIRVSLTENSTCFPCNGPLYADHSLDDPDTPDLLIFAELRDAPPSSSDVPMASTSISPPKVLHLLAARILPGPPPPPSFRMPRPDDPTPRKPPASFGAKRKRDTSGVPFDLSAAVGAKRTKTGDAKGKGRAGAMDEEAMRKAAAEVMLRMPKPGVKSLNVKALGKDARVGVKKDVFKVPSVPVRRTASESDVFGSVANGPSDAPGADGGIEKENKMVRRFCSLPTILAFC